jgi:hypothetical protein
VPAAPEYAASSHPVETPIETLGCRTQDERREDPSGNGTDEGGQRRREVDERQRDSGPYEGRTERHSGLN